MEEWEKTVMNKVQLQHLWGNANWQYITGTMVSFFAVVANSQAEISFKAGQESMRDSMSEAIIRMWKVGRQEGIKEVVKAIEKRNWFANHAKGCLATEDSDICNFGWCGVCWWQAKVKEWGVEK